MLFGLLMDLGLSERQLLFFSSIFFALMTEEEYEVSSDRRGISMEETDKEGYR